MVTERYGTSYFKIKSLNETEQKHSKHCAGEIAVHLNKYEDIFSDFDPRPFSERALSDDFIAELKKANRVKGDEPLHLSFILDDEKRNIREEYMIKKRLIDFAKKHYVIAKKEIRDIRKKGLMFVVIGAIIMLGAAYIRAYLLESLLKNILFVALEPAGWFLTWQGFEKMLGTANLHHDHVKFYQKLEQAEITFTSY